MSLKDIGVGDKAPETFNVIIEIPAQGDPVKYEVDKDTGALMVDRFMTTAMHYPCNYGYIPCTLADDGDPVDVLVLTPFPVLAGSVIECRALGMLAMTDEAGEDAKLLAVPIDKLTGGLHQHMTSPEDVPEITRAQITHFFEHYKDLEKGKWVRVDGWKDVSAAHKEITDGMDRYPGS